MERYQQILYDVEDPVAIITLNRPELLNAWTQRMAAEVRHALARAEQDSRVVAIVLTGAGRGFCAGADLDFLKDIATGNHQAEATDDLEADPGDPQMGASFRQTYSYLMSVRKPIIAAINGPVAGLALPITLYCDLRFASDRASFLTAFPRRGLIAEWGIGWALPRLVGPAHALDLLLSGRQIDASEAERMGLVNRVVPHDELMKHVREYVDELATACSPASMQIIKRQIYQAWMEPLSEAFEKSLQLMLESFRRPDFLEGVQSFRQKRPARFARLGETTRPERSKP